MFPPQGREGRREGGSEWAENESRERARLLRLAGWPGAVAGRPPSPPGKLRKPADARTVVSDTAFCSRGGIIQNIAAGKMGTLGWKVKVYKVIKDSLPHLKLLYKRKYCGLLFFGS